MGITHGCILINRLNTISSMFISDGKEKGSMINKKTNVVGCVRMNCSS